MSLTRSTPIPFLEVIDGRNQTRLTLGRIQLAKRVNIPLLLDHIAVVPVKHVRVAVTHGLGSQAGMLGFCQMVRSVAVPQTVLGPRIPLLARCFLKRPELPTKIFANLSIPVF